MRVILAKVMVVMAVILLIVLVIISFHLCCQENCWIQWVLYEMLVSYLDQILYY